MRKLLELNNLPPQMGTHHIYKALNIHPSTLRTYELEGLITPFYCTGKRYFSQEQAIWISCIEHMINDKGISIPGLTKLLELCPCWEIAQCPKETKEKCKAKYISLGLIKNDKYIKQYHTEPDETFKADTSHFTIN